MSMKKIQSLVSKSVKFKFHSKSVPFALSANFGPSSFRCQEGKARFCSSVTFFMWEYVDCDLETAKAARIFNQTLIWLSKRMIPLMKKIQMVLLQRTMFQIHWKSIYFSTFRQYQSIKWLTKIMSPKTPPLLVKCKLRRRWKKSNMWFWLLLIMFNKESDKYV